MSKIVNPGFLRETALYAEEYMKANLPENIVFHNYNRTAKIARICDTLSIQSDLKESEKMLLHLASLFLDMGYCHDPKNSAAVSARLARNYFSAKGLDDASIKVITESLEAIGYPQQPVSLVAQYLCDADMYYLGSNNYSLDTELMRNEISLVDKINFTDREWIKKQLQLLTDHTYFTSEARRLFKKRKKNNIILLQNQLNRVQTHNETDVVAVPENLQPEPDRDFKPERGVETLFRVTARKQLDLTSMADNKANLIIGVNTIIISIMLSVLGTKLNENSHLLIPSILIILTNATTIVIAILATRPKIIRADDHVPGKESAEFNILFFGHFSRMSLENYKETIRKTIMNKEDIYDTISRDIYYQGIILSKKYRYIALAYNIFVVGLIISILAFIAAFILHQ
ncbi:MAG: metal-dependent phosphohydrolase sub domain [Chitinophagaceae bacterium]|nr:metal-dependent phosphohydrolase sub domain [Chitinophagaceae bacterium]